MTIHCNCETLGRSIDRGELLTTHGKECPLREGELIGLLLDLTIGIEEWAGEEDGVYSGVWEHYRKAKAMIGCPVPQGLESV